MKKNDSIKEFEGYLPGLLDIKIDSIEQGKVFGSMKIMKKHLAPNGYMHAGAVATFADTVCGYGTYTHLPEGAKNFTSIEFKSNFLGTALKGTVYCEAVAEHFGKTTQVWSAVVKDENGKKITLFRATQMILY